MANRNNQNQSAADAEAKAAADAEKVAKPSTIIIVNQCNNQHVDPDTGIVFRSGQQTPVKGPVKEGSWLDCQINAKLLAVVE